MADERIDFDDFADSYERDIEKSIAFSGAEHALFLRIKADLLVDLAGRHLGDVSKLEVLDVGCGVGEAHRFLEGRFGALHGVDVAGDAVGRARERHPWATYTTSRAGDPMPFEEGVFDLAFAVCVVHHVPPKDWLGFVTEMRRVVRPGGVVAVFEHNPLNPLTRKVVNDCEFDADAVLLSRRRAAVLQRDAGLERLESPYIVFFPREGRTLRAIERYLRWLPVGAQYYVASRKPG